MAVEAVLTATLCDFSGSLVELCRPWDRGPQVGNHWPNFKVANYSVCYLTRNPLRESTFCNLLQTSDILDSWLLLSTRALTCKIYWTHVNRYLKLRHTTETYLTPGGRIIQNHVKFLSANFRCHAPCYLLKVVLSVYCFLNVVFESYAQRMVSHMAPYRVTE